MKAPSRVLSKSKLLSYRQCHKRLWLEVHRPKLREDSGRTEASFVVGRAVGEMAQRLYDPAGTGTLVDAQTDGIDIAVRQTRGLLESPRPIFEAGFSTDAARAFADVLLPVRKAGKKAWRMVEVKSSTEVKDYHLEDAAIQAHVAREARVPLDSISIAHIDNQWVYPGNDKYDGILKEVDVTEEAFGLRSEVKSWIAEAQQIVRKKTEPAISTGKHCSKPFECGFYEYCTSKEKQPKYPAAWLPDVRTTALKNFIESKGVDDLRKVPDTLLNDRQRRVKAHSLSGVTFFDAKGAKADLAPHKPPAYFLDFETINFAIPVWKGMRPYRQVPFQFSVHRLSKSGDLDHESFLDLSGNDPSKVFAEALVAACGERGPVFVYNAGFERARIKELALRMPRQRKRLEDINNRVVDLLKIARERYYHPAQEGSWSLKAVLPTIAAITYDALEGVQDGGAAMEAYLEGISPSSGPERKKQLGEQLLAYCKQDTYALVKVWQRFAGRQDLSL